MLKGKKFNGHFYAIFNEILAKKHTGPPQMGQPSIDLKEQIPLYIKSHLQFLHLVKRKCTAKIPFHIC